MRELTDLDLVRLLEKWRGMPINLEQVANLGMTHSGAEALKGFGYGKPLQITYHLLETGEVGNVVLRRVNRNGFGREQACDQAAEVWRDFHAFSLLPHHVTALALVLQHTDGELEPLQEPQELLLLTDFVPGEPYANDLFRIRQTGRGNDLDGRRIILLADYLADIHTLKHDDYLLWRRRLRDLIGHGEGIMGLADSYPADDPIATREKLITIEECANRWRWRLKPYTRRLCQVHGDFHPFNILFDKETDLYLVDRSRGEWGAPEDDVSCLTINFLFFSLQRSGRLEGAFENLYHLFWEKYLARTGDDEMGDVIAPWFAWRALVLASPVWYPNSPVETRQKLINFARNVLELPRFEWQKINDYLD